MALGPKTDSTGPGAPKRNSTTHEAVGQPPAPRAPHQAKDTLDHRSGRVSTLEIEGLGRYSRYGAGPPIVVLSNPQADPDWWTPPFVAAFGSAGYETITFVHTGASYIASEVISDVATFVERLQTVPVRLMGWSQGAAIAQEVALLRPELVACAALVAGYG